MLAQTSCSATASFSRSRPRCAGSRSTWVANAAPLRGVISVKVISFAWPTSVSSNRRSRTGAFSRRGGVEGHVADPQVVVLENLEPALGLHDMVLAFGAPAHHGFLVAPGRVRQHPSRPAACFQSAHCRRSRRSFPGSASSAWRGRDRRPSCRHWDALQRSLKTSRCPFRAVQEGTAAHVVAAQEVDAFAPQRRAHRFEMHQMGAAADLDVALDRRLRERVEQPARVIIAGSARPIRRG